MAVITRSQGLRWQDHPVTRTLLNSPVYRPYMWARYAMDRASLPALVAIANHPPRRFHAYVVGTMKSGTTSLGQVLKSRYRTQHEALPRQSCLTTVLYKSGHLTSTGLRTYILRRDSYLGLELESSWFLLDWVDVLVKTFPAAKFILPIREPYSWLNSMINQELSTNLSVRASYWKLLFDQYFQDYDTQPEDAPLLQQGVHSVSAYLKHWNNHHLQLMTTIPAGRLLLLRTDQLTEKAATIANFLGVESQLFLESNFLENKTKVFHINVPQQVSGEYIRDSVYRHCSPSLLALFPETYS